LKTEQQSCNSRSKKE